MCCRQPSVSAALLAVSQPRHVSPCDTPAGLAAVVAASRSCRQPLKKQYAGVCFFLMILPEVLGRWRRLLGSPQHLPAFPPGFMGTRGEESGSFSRSFKWPRPLSRCNKGWETVCAGEGRVGGVQEQSC